MSANRFHAAATLRDRDRRIAPQRQLSSARADAPFLIFKFTGSGIMRLMKVGQLLGLLLIAGVLCSCASNAPYSETMIDTSTQKRNAVLPDAPPQAPITYQPGLDSGPGFGPPGGH